ncbi:hypothetical protein B0H10DRAFT_1937872 [Mycena sp. CBHHK59/15]|nr:hypothetical protein B0H10DRAFT_1937872 [Mycena sp. CBHHK59/15]
MAWNESTHGSHGSVIVSTRAGNGRTRIKKLPSPPGTHEFSKDREGLRVPASFWCNLNCSQQSFKAHLPYQNQSRVCAQKHQNLYPDLLLPTGTGTQTREPVFPRFNRQELAGDPDSFRYAVLPAAVGTGEK